MPGANSFDPTGLAGGGYSPLTTFILGGRTQVQKAVEVDPTFATVWIGNNDVLGFALAGTTDRRDRLRDLHRELRAARRRAPRRAARS